MNDNVTRIRVEEYAEDPGSPAGHRVFRFVHQTEVWRPIATFHGPDAKVWLDSFMNSLHAGLYLAFAASGHDYSIDGWNPK